MRSLVSPKNDILKRSSDEVAKGQNVSEQIDAMWSIMYQNNGIGLAANQVGDNNRVIVIHAGDFKQEFINPVITKKFGGTKKSIEGCLSFPGKQVKKFRSKRIVIEGYDRDWNLVKFNLKGIASACAQHEVDHLNGVTI